MKRLLASVLLAPLLVLIAACGASSTTLTANDFDTSCSADKDCIAVALGDLCDKSGCGNCPTGSINASSEKDYAARSEDIRASCDTPGHALACLCVSHSVKCEESICVLH